MAVAEDQLEIWARVGAVAQSRQTYASVRSALGSLDAPYAARSYEIFLQGSYGNDTNIWADSDVDVVIRLDDTFYKDVSDLPAEQLAAYNSHFSSATYTYAEFKTDVTSQLGQKFGAGVKAGKKAIVVPGNGSRRDVDVLAAAQFRKYWAFRSAGDQSFTEGVVFWTPDGTQIINYPKLHSANCTSKHQATTSWFKPCVRILKNMRNAMVGKQLMAAGLAPSYFLEGMLWNVPDAIFRGSYIETIAGALNWIRECDRSRLVCPNGMYYLLHPSSPVTWRAEQLETYLRSTIAFWNEQ